MDVESAAEARAPSQNEMTRFRYDVVAAAGAAGDATGRGVA